jgi:hypothetical protein
MRAAEVERCHSADDHQARKVHFHSRLRSKICLMEYTHCALKDSIVLMVAATKLSLQQMNSVNYFGVLGLA